jgi:hypothetical protein
MNYYENKVLQDRESHLTGAGVTFLLMSPAFGIIAGAFLASATALYVTTVAVALAGVAGIVAGVMEKIDRKRNQNS